METEVKNKKTENKIKTEEIVIGDKTFKVRTKPSYRILNECAQMGIYLNNVTDPLKAAEIQAGMQHKVLKLMVVEPVITDEYLDNEAGIEEFNLSVQLSVEIKKIMQDINDKQKKN